MTPACANFRRCAWELLHDPKRSGVKHPDKTGSDGKRQARKPLISLRHAQERDADNPDGALKRVADNPDDGGFILGVPAKLGVGAPTFPTPFHSTFPRRPAVA